MSESIDGELVQRVAKLARLAIDQAQLDSAAQQMQQVIGYVDQLNAVEIPETIEPFFGAAETVNAIRADLVESSYDRESILRNAPDSDGEHYCVPPVF